jgi:hypothetical protein
MNKKKEELLAWKEFHKDNTKFYGEFNEAGDAHAGGTGKHYFPHTALMKVNQELNQLR